VRERGRSVPLKGCVRIGGTGQLDLGRSAQAAPAVGPTVAALKRVPQQQARRLVARSAGAQRSSFAVGDRHAGERPPPGSGAGRLAAAGRSAQASRHRVAELVIWSASVFG